jgi:hypothetical protein
MALGVRSDFGQFLTLATGSFRVGYCMRASVISSEADEGGVVTLAIGGVQITAMDHLGYGVSKQAVPRIGDEFAVSFSCLFPDDVSWDDVFSGNPDGRSELVPAGL